MIETLVTFLQENILPLGAGGVFLASVIEEVVAPIPSALVMALSGFLFVSGPINVWNILSLIFLVAVPAAFGVTLGSLFIYGVAWWGRKAALLKWGKWIGLSWNDIEVLKARLEKSKKDEKTIILARVIPIIPSVAISALCGFIQMRPFKYIRLTFLGMFIRAIILASLGWQVGNVYYRYVELISRFEKYILIIILILACIFIINLFIRRKKSLAERNS